MLGNFAECLNIDKIYKFNEIEKVLKIVRTNFRFSCVNTKHKYFNVPAALDLETSSFYDKGEKVGIMYAWGLGIYGVVIIGRTWEELNYCIAELVKILDLCDRKRLIIYVENLQFDFQFFRSHFTFDKVFASDRRRPLYALTDCGIEFRCSYMLSGLSLEKMGENLLKYKRKKMVGDLNYDLVRTPETPMKKKETVYLREDVKVVMAYIAEEIERCNGIARIPLTKTGYVRNYCRRSCFNDPKTGRRDFNKAKKFRELMSIMTLTPDIYDHVKQAFAGGYVHANVLKVHEKDPLENVASWDLTSSYPAIMCAERFPMGQPNVIDTKTLTKEQFLHYRKLYACVFTIHFWNIKETPTAPDNYISQSKCIKCDGAVVNNGRVVSAGYLEITITEVDLDIIEKVYTWEGSYQISYLVMWPRGYLPRDFVLAILELYKKKTELKGIQKKAAEYMVSKGMINSCYGMAVTDLLREINDYENGKWKKPYYPDLETEINKYNRKSSRFLYFPWGIYVTAFGRRNIFELILEAGKEDYCYCDTDSVKMLNGEKHIDFIEKYNKNIIAKLEYALTQQNIPLDYIRPKTIKGEEKPLGVFDYEGTYSRFKTLGSKRYMTEIDGELSLTVAGVNKKNALPYLYDKYKTNDNIFKHFRWGLKIPAGRSGKLTHIYIDCERSGTVKDYTGRKYKYNEKTGIHMEPATYKLSLGSDFNKYLVSKFGGI